MLILAPTEGEAERRTFVGCRQGAQSMSKHSSCLQFWVKNNSLWFLVLVSTYNISQKVPFACSYTIRAILRWSAQEITLVLISCQGANQSYSTGNPGVTLTSLIAWLPMCSSLCNSYRNWERKGRHWKMCLDRNISQDVLFALLWLAINLNTSMERGKGEDFSPSPTNVPKSLLFSSTNFLFLIWRGEKSSLGRSKRPCLFLNFAILPSLKTKS